MKRLFIIALALVSAAHAQQLTVGNGIVERMVDCSDGHVRSGYYRLTASGTEFISKNSEEFSLSVNDVRYSGNSSWKDFVIRDTVAVNGMTGKILSFSDESRSFDVEIAYLTCPGISVLKKEITINNVSGHDLRIENVDVENFGIAFVNNTDGWVLHNFARDKEYGGPLAGNWNDPLMIIHDGAHTYSGMAIGNEAVGVMKRTAAFQDGYRLEAGLARITDPFPFRRWLSPGQKWTCDAVFTAPYVDRDPQKIVNTDIQAYIRKYMGTQIESRNDKPMFVYNTWIPFTRNIDEASIFEIATAAAECGVGEFIIDDGWQINLRESENGKISEDWSIDTIKFPRGLKPVFDSIKKLGMKPGLWISVANMYYNTTSNVKHPEWKAVDKNGKYTSLHGGWYSNPTACMGTDWCDYIRDIVLEYVRDYGLAYVKMDLAITTSAYIYDETISGCYATDHKYHRDHYDSHYVIYEKCMKMFDELHAAAPELFIDCTFETAGKVHLMDYGIAKHADGNWLSNISEEYPQGSLRVRDLAWKRTPALPATSLVIGNLTVDGEGHFHSLKSLTGTLPIMLGDPRKLSAEEKAEYRKWSQWLNDMQSRHSILSFRQDLPGFGEPGDGMWDGFSRINVDTKSGGIVGVFRQNAPGNSRTVVLENLDPKSVYLVKTSVTGKVVAKMTGADLAEKGFTVNIPQKIGGEIFEVVKQ